MASLRRLLLILAPLLAWSAPADAAPPLTMRAADRAMDLALQAELAGDFAGAESALLRLIETSTKSIDTAGRDRLSAYVRSLRTRKAAFADGRTAEAYRVAYESMRPFGLARSEHLWRRAKDDLPQLGTQAVVALKLERVKGVKNASAALRRVRTVVEQHGLSVGGEQARFLVRINLDASDVEPSPRGTRVTAEVSAVVNDQKAKPLGAGSFAKRRAERRRRVEDARRLAVFRVLDDVGRRVVFLVRARLLADAARPT